MCRCSRPSFGLLAPLPSVLTTPTFYCALTRDFVFIFRFADRFSLALSAFFLACCLGTAAAPGFHGAALGLKGIVLFLLVVSSFFVPEPFFVGWGWFARVVSCLFLCVQVLILVDFAFELHEYLLAKAGLADETTTISGGAEYEIAEEGDGTDGECCSCGPGCYQALYIALSIGCVAISIAAMALVMVYYTCDLSYGLVTLNGILGVIIVFVSATSAVGVGLVPPSITWLYNTYLLWSSLSSNPDGACNPLLSSTSNAGLAFVSIAIACFSLVYSTTRTASAAPDLFRNDGENKGAGGGPGDGLSDAEAGAAKPKSVTASSSGGDASGYGSTAGREEEVRTAEAEGEDAAAAADPLNFSATDDGKMHWFFHFIMLTGAVCKCNQLVQPSTA